MVLLALALMGGLFSIFQYHQNQEKLELAAGQTARMEEELAALKGKGSLVQQELTPDQQKLLVASHKLVASKSFGWSRLFADLEAALPGGVSASRISVENIYKDGDRIKAELELGVLSRDYQAVMGMIGSMNNAGVFQAELRGQDLQKNERLTFTEYTLRLIYTPAYGYPTATTTDVASSEPGGEQR